MADGLTGFVPFACDNQEVARTDIGDCNFNRPTAVGDLDGIGSRSENRASDFRRLFVSRIVVRHVNPICQAGCYPPHQRPLAGIAVTAAAEQGNQSPWNMRAQCRKDGRKRVRRVGVVDNDPPPSPSSATN